MPKAAGQQMWFFVHFLQHIAGATALFSLAGKLN
jgi:hypothetical protein